MGPRPLYPLKSGRVTLTTLQRTGQVHPGPAVIVKGTPQTG